MRHSALGGTFSGMARVALSGGSPMPTMPSAHAEAQIREGGGRRFIAGVAVLVAVVLLQQLAQYITNRDQVRLVSVMMWFSLELPTLLWTLSFLFRWSRARQVPWGGFVALGMLLAAAVGGAWGALFFFVSHDWPQLGLRAFTTQPVSLMRTVLYGLTQAQTQFGLWTLAFALPSMLEAARVRELQAQKLEAESQQLRSAAELARLRSHLEPHFLLNTLNAIAGLVTEEPKQARRLLSALGDLLRDALRNQHESQPLAAQIEWLKRYAQILEARHRGDLSFSWDIAPETEQASLPPLLLQPLVENAVKHGALRAKGPGQVWIKAELLDHGKRLCCSVRDNGPGTHPGPVRVGAFGLESVRRRIQLRYGDRGEVSLESLPNGTLATVIVPALGADKTRTGEHEQLAEST
jgi:signal transduction histidine kinase